MTNTKVKSSKYIHPQALSNGSTNFLLGVVSHGILDYVPHCYPVNPKTDAIIGLLLIPGLIYFTKIPYRIAVAGAFSGSLFPDLVDLSPGILNSLLHLNLPTFAPIFPWHWHAYSGSIYSNNCQVSHINHLLVLLTVGLICWIKHANLRAIIK